MPETTTPEALPSPATITEIRIGIARTINLGNFESLRIEGSLIATLAEGDDLTATKAGLQLQLRTLIEETYRAQHKPKEPAPRPGLQPPASFKTPDPEY